ncbi:hypothetical protein GCM10007079_36300 [Nocardiopsis terrae]|nr:hypothetical protein GCM10007079_36300 [Nocardiopsis terrae]
MSWHPLVLRFPPSGKSTGSLTRAASAGLSTGISMTEILSCGGWQFGNRDEGEYEDTYT